MIQLRELCSGIGRLQRPEDGDVWVERVDHDSRRVAPRSFFMALPGRQTDGLRYVQQAIDLGAVAIGIEEGAEVPIIDSPIVWFSKARPALAVLAKRVVDSPTDDLELIAVTGTNGKTSVTTILHHILTSSNRIAGLIGTIETKIGSRRLPTSFTTPESTDLFRLLRQMKDADVEFVCAEFSSIGMDEHRVDGTEPRFGAYLNLSQDHLDYHGSMEAYAAAKTRLFLEHLACGGHALICIDDETGLLICESVRAQRPDVTVWSVSTQHKSADVFGELAATESGITGEVVTPNAKIPVRTALLGGFNRQNLTVSVALASCLGIGQREIAKSLIDVRIPGRLELVPRDDKLRTVVDYAHTPEALQAAVDALRPQSSGRIICVFGCGGDRDQTKRPRMAVAASKADLSIVTSDNPRNEAPESIIAEVIAGFDADARFEIEVDRKAAIHRALSLAQPNDIVLIAGKGHETYQEIAGRRFPFSDVDVVRAWQGGGAS